MMKKKNIDIEELKRLIEESSMKKRFVKDIKRNCEIKSIRFGIMSKEDIIKYSEVKIMNREMYKNNSGIPYPYGVLDLKLGAHKSNSVCETCNKKLINCSGHFGYIELNYPVFHIGYYKYIIHILYCICKYCSSLLLSKEKIEFYCNLKKKSTDDSFYKKHLFKRILNNCKKVNKCYICGNPQGVIKKIIKPSLDQFMKLKHILKVKENGKMIIKEEDLNSLYVLKLFKNINPYHVKLLNIENPEKLIITALLVPPNTIRPSVIIDEHGTAEDDLTCILSEITQLNNTIYNQCTNGYQTNQFLGNVEFLQLQITRFINSDSPAVSQLLATQNISKPGRGICQRLKGKEGRFRCNLSGKRVDFSSRTVISPDPNISIDEVVIPKIIAMRLTYPETVNKYNIDKLKMLIKNGCNKWPGANYIIKKSKKGIDPYSDISTSYNNNSNNISSIGCSNIFNVVNNYINNNCKNVRYNIKDVNNNVLLKDMCDINNMNNDINNNINNIYKNTSETNLCNVNNHNNNNNIYCNNQTQDNEEERKNSQFNKISLKYANKNHVIQNLNIGDVVERHICDGDIVLFNRQPSLHRMSIMCHKAKIMDFKTFRFNECVCSPYNADFDGDEMNLHVPQTEEARAEALYLMNVKHNLITPKNGEVIIALTQDFLSASYIITNKDTFLDRDTFCLLCSYFSDASLYIELPIPAILKPKELWTGKQLISVLIKPNKKENTIINFEIQEREYSNKFGDLKHLCLNDSYVCFYKSELICGSLGKKVLGSSKYGLFYYLIHHNSSHIALKIMNRLSKLTSRYFSNKGMTIGIDDVRPSQTLTEKKKDLLLKGYEKVNNEIILYNEKKMQIQPGCTLEETLEIKVKSILDDLRNDAGKTCNQYLHYLNKPLIMFNSGAKGALINIAQMIACVGQQNVAGQRIQNGFINRTLPHFHFHCKDSESRGFVQNSFYTGLSPTEFFFHTMSGREGLVDTAVKTAETGYMQRRLMKALEDLSIHYDYSVRSCDKQIVQFIYGDDALNPSYIDNNNTYLDQFDKVFDHIVSISSSHLLLSYKNKIPYLPHVQHQNKTSNMNNIYNNMNNINNNDSNRSIIYNNDSNMNNINNNDSNMNSIHNNNSNMNNIHNNDNCTHNPYICNESLIIRNIMNRLIYQNIAQEDLFIPLEHDEFLFFIEKKKGKMHECNDDIEYNNTQYDNIQYNNISCNYIKSQNLENTHHQVNNDLSFIKNNVILPPKEYHSIFHFVNDYRNVVEIKNLMDKKKIFLNNSEKNVVQSKYNRMSKNLKKKIEIINNIYRNEKKKLNRWKTKMDNDDNYCNMCDKNNDFSDEFFNNINENDLLYDNKYYRQIFKNVIGFVSVFEYVESYKQHYILFPYEIIKWTSFLLEYLTEIIPTNIFLHTKLSKKEKPTHQKNTGKMKIYIEEIKKWLFIKAINIYKYFSFKKSIELIKKKDYFNYIIKNYDISHRYIIHDYSFINLKQLYLFIFFNIYKYFKYISTPGDAVGSISAQSIGEPGTQMTLKTFHFAGVASMNVTLGVPRIKEIINASNSIQTPILNIPLEVNDNYNFALMMKSKLEKTTIRDICMYIKEDYTSRGVFLSVKFNEELIQKLFLNINAYNIKDIILKQSHINKIKINKIHINVINKYKLHISLKNDEFIFFQMESLKKGLLDLLIYGDKDIKRCIIKKEDIEVTDNEDEIWKQKTYSKKKKKKTVYSILVEGNSLNYVLGLEGVDFKHIISNHVINVFQVLGIEAARITIINEIKKCVEAYSIDIDIRHIMLLADIMAFTGDILGINRFGIQKARQSTLMLASFEETNEHLFVSSFFKNVDEINNISESIIVGKNIPIGTGAFQLLYDYKFEKETKNLTLLEKAERETAMNY
ncbi:DNA-directed RNA polymerase III subunit RPC1 [Plasmodium falciparum Palo Alto/Uganda]|uniref:DNA-directed RNA polymerase subunit n=1 Tax=Plasmodium falciparum (isolate Palo Alto / Uganda) TaxID=57270 RepID=W4IXP3_PLAFP|nr:DNA-directed RNA polymerase III subunit RPC1 [Plasmodium falciparum Palo Alto/Uganda]